MARRFGTGQKSNGGGGNELRCLVCNEAVPRTGVFKQGMIEHCDARSSAFGALRMEAHHVTRKHPRCWSCGSDMGCQRCAGTERELLCTSHHGQLGRLGAVWASKASLLEHGPMENQGQAIEDYPAEWREEYRRTQPANNGARFIRNWAGVKAAADRIAARIFPTKSNT